MMIRTWPARDSCRSQPTSSESKEPGYIVLGRCVGR